MITVGMELEFFVKDRDGLCICPDYLPRDGYPLLAEARGKPAPNAREAVHLLQSEVARMEDILMLRGLPVDIFTDTVQAGVDGGPSFVKVPRGLKQKLARISDKPRVRYENIYGHQDHGAPYNIARAGLHISFTKKVDVYCGACKKTHTSNGMFDYVSIFRKLDERFSAEIKKAKRKPGFFEIKSDGRIEYRSLPACLWLPDVWKALDSILGNRNYV